MMTEQEVITEEVHDAVVSSADNKPVQFSVTDAAIAEMREKFMPLRIAGPTDKAGFQAVYDARMIVKRSRVDVDKKRKELNEDALKWQRKVNGEAQRITAGLSEIETHLELEETAYNNEIKRIADEKAEAERQRYQSRVLQLKDWGFTYDDFFDAYFLGGVVINKDDIKNLSDEDYSTTFNSAQKAHETEQARLAEIQRVEDEKAQQLILEQKAEQDRIAEQNRVLAEQQAELKRQQDELEADRKKLQDEKDQALLKARIDRLIAAGFTDLGTPNAYHHGNVKIREGVILSFDDAQFDSVITDAAAYDRRIEQERKDKEAAEADRIKAEKQAEKARKAADKERKARLAPDKKAMKAWAIRLGNYPNVETTQDEASELAVLFLTRLSALAQEFVIEIDAL